MNNFTIDVQEFNQHKYKELNKNLKIWLVMSIFDHTQLKIYRWFENPAISLAENILAFNSRARIFPDIRFVQAEKLIISTFI